MGNTTPGPWAIQDLDDNEYQIFELTPYEKGIVNQVWTTAICVLESREEAESNANLIAAAPELLGALKNIENDNNHIPQPIWALVKNVIDKAEGRA